MLAAETPPLPPALTSAQLVGQRMVFAYAGRRPPAALERRIARGEAAGVILFARNVGTKRALRATLARLQAISRPAGLRAPLLVLVDQEGGPVRRIPGSPTVGAAATRGAAQARRLGRAAARTLRDVGANVDLAPVADVARPGAALDRERRTYGGDAQTVTRFAGAFADGLQAGGVAATFKHFPGFGAAAVNTDDAPARIDATLGTLRGVDLRPYRRVPSRLVMLSTAVYPARDARPAALSRAWATTELRGTLGFDGVSISDDLQTPAVRSFSGPGRLATLAVSAGVDLPLFAQSYTAGAQAARALESAARARRIARADLETAAARVLALRGTLPRP